MSVLCVTEARTLHENAGINRNAALPNVYAWTDFPASCSLIVWREPDRQVRIKRCGETAQQKDGRNGATALNARDW
jgi:hypothetical protein